MNDVQIKSPITLGQLLKKVNIISSGGEAKTFLTTHHVTVNGIREQRRGKKLNTGDTIHATGYGTWHIVHHMDAHA